VTASRESAPLLSDPNLHVVFSVTLMAVLGVASITPAFPSISAQLGVSPQQVGLLISVFTLPGVVFTPGLGILADRYGRKPVLVPSLMLFAIAGGACGLARDFEVLLVLRTLQGVGAASLGAINVTIIGDLYEEARRTTAMGYNAAVLSIGTAIYPAIGGALAAIAWYAPFFLPLAAMAVGMAVLLVLRSPTPKSEGRLVDYLRDAHRAMRRRESLVMFTASIVAFVLIYGAYLSYFPFLLAQAFELTEIWIGLVMALTSTTTALGSFRLGTLAHRFSERRLVTAGFVLYTLSMAAIPFARPLPVLIAAVLLFGFANGITIPSILAILSRIAPPELRAVFMSVNGMLLRLGQTLGPILAGAAYLVFGIEATFWASAILAVGMLVTLVVSERGKSGRVARRRAPPHLRLP